MLPRLREAAGALVTGHCVFTAAGIGVACTSRLDAPATAPSDPRCSKERALAAAMYSGRGLDEQACSPRVTFTDPVARCSGRREVSEAFRALTFCRPEHVEAPRANFIDDLTSTVDLHQRYFSCALLPSGLVVRSTLLVRRRAADGLVCELEERWNGALLFGWVAFRWARRVNGMLSSLLTPLLLR